MFDVVEIVPKLCSDARFVRIWRQLNLGQTSYPRAHLMPLSIAGYGFLKLSDKGRSFGPGADETHVAPNDIPELGQLIDVSLPQNVSKRCDARVIQ